MLKTIRPVGNRVKYTSLPFDEDAVKPYRFYGFESGTAALAFALLMVKLRREDISLPEVLLPAYTCPDLISACLYAKIKPILIDLDENSPWMNIEQIKNQLNSSTIAVIAINFLGIPERMSLLSKLKEKYDFEIIEDSAQGFPLKSPSNYWNADLVITSFGRGKPLNLLGGGALLVKNKDYQPYLRNISLQEKVDGSWLEELNLRVKIALFNIVSRPTFYFFLSRASFLKIGQTVFKPMKTINTLSNTILKRFRSNYLRYQLRHQPINRYHNLFDNINSDQLINLAKLCQLNKNHPLLRFPILIKNKELRKLIFDDLSKYNLGASLMYEKILPFIEGINPNLFPENQQYENAENFSNQLITLPTHQDVSEKIIKQIEAVFNKHLN